jgi:Predicted transcriptional regulator
MANFLEKLPPDLAVNRVLNTAEAAALLNFSIPHLRRLYRRGIIPPPIRLSSRKLGWKAQDLVTWLNTRSREGV